MSVWTSYKIDQMGKRRNPRVNRHLQFPQVFTDVSGPGTPGLINTPQLSKGGVGCDDYVQRGRIPTWCIESPITGGFISGACGSAANPTYGFTCGPDGSGGGKHPNTDYGLGMYHYAEDTIGFAVAATPKVLVNAKGLVMLSGQVFGPATMLTKTADYEIGVDDNIVGYDCTSGNLGAKLPSPSTVDGKSVTIKKLDNTANYLTIYCTNGEKIDERYFFNLAYQGGSIELVADATNTKWIVKANTEPNFIKEAISGATVANPTTAETTLIGTTVGYPHIGANRIKLGSELHIKASGVYSTSATGNQVNFRINIGGTTISSTGNFVPTVSMTDREWIMEATITCRSVGVTGTVFGQAYLDMSQNPAVTLVPHRLEMLNTASDTVNTTTDNTLDFTADWVATSAGDSITCTNFTATLI